MASELKLFVYITRCATLLCQTLYLYCRYVYVAIGLISFSCLVWCFLLFSLPLRLFGLFVQRSSVKHFISVEVVVIGQ